MIALNLSLGSYNLSASTNFISNFLNILVEEALLRRTRREEIGLFSGG